MTLRAHIKLFQIVYKVSFFITLLPHGGHHGACCVTSYGLHMSAIPFLRVYMTSYSSSGQGLGNLLIG